MLINVLMFLMESENESLNGGGLKFIEILDTEKLFYEQCEGRSLLNGTDTSLLSNLMNSGNS